MDNFFNANDDLVAIILSFLGRTDYYNARHSIPGIARLIERRNIPRPFPEMDMFAIGREGLGGFEFQSPVWSPTGDSITCHLLGGIYNFHFVNGTARYSHWFPDPHRAHTNFQSLLFTENGSLMVTVDWRYSVRVWDNRNPTNRQLLHELQIGNRGEGHVIPRVAITPDGTRLFSLTNTKLYIYDITNILTADEIHSQRYNHHVSLQTDNMLLHPNGTIIIYNFESNDRSGIAVTSFSSGTTFRDTQQELIVDMALASDGSMFALAHINGSVSLWTINIVDDESVTNAYYDESDIIVECINTNIFSSEELYTPRYIPDRPLYAVSFSHDDRYIIAGDSRRVDTTPGCKLRFYNIANGETRSEPTGTFGNVNTICPSPDGTRLVFRSGLTMYFTTRYSIVQPFG